MTRTPIKTRSDILIDAIRGAVERQRPAIDAAVPISSIMVVARYGQSGNWPRSIEIKLRDEVKGNKQNIPP